jgi:hypothetical protein
MCSSMYVSYKQIQTNIETHEVRYLLVVVVTKHDRSIVDRVKRIQLGDVELKIDVGRLRTSMSICRSPIQTLPIAMIVDLLC